MLTIITFIITFSLFYYSLRWRLYTRLKIIDSSNPLQTDVKSPRSPSPKSISMIPANTNEDYEDDQTDDAEIVWDENNGEEQDEEKVAVETGDSDDKQIKILTQNLWIHYLAPSPCKVDRIKAFIQFLKQKRYNYDILIIQEIFGLRFGPWIRCNDLEFLVKQLYKIGYIYYTKPSGNLPYFGQNGGIMIFSRYPLIYDDVFRFNKSDEIMLRKGFAITITKIPINTINNDDKYYYLCIGTGHCDPYRPSVILSQIEQFSKEIKCQYDNYKKQINNDHHIDIIVGGDFNTRNKALTKGLKDYFEDIISMYNAWTLKGNDREQWNRDNITYRSAYIPKYRLWGSILSCGLCPLPTLNQLNGKYINGYCLDHLLTNIQKKYIENISVVDSRYKNVFVSDHLGVELTISLPK